ncbi:MAG: hypothetical protein HKO59_14255 [Phycisphaerales bacterium]|nr:hypothetical protein [Phycisphaerales bacterium]
MAATLKKHFDVDSELIKGEKGIFDVAVDGDVIFSKHHTGRFPTDEEIVSILEA